MKGQVKLYDSDSFYNTITFNESTRKITGIKFLKSHILVTSSLDGVVRLYDLNKRKLFKELIGEN